MTPKHMPRRDFLASCLAGIPVVALDWESFPREAGRPIERERPGLRRRHHRRRIGRPELRRRLRPAGFPAARHREALQAGRIRHHLGRPRGFRLRRVPALDDVGERDGVYDLFRASAEVEGVTFVPSKVLYRVVFCRARYWGADRDVPRYMPPLSDPFPEDGAASKEAWSRTCGPRLRHQKVLAAAGRSDITRFVQASSMLAEALRQALGAFVDAGVGEPESSGPCCGSGLRTHAIEDVPRYWVLPTMGWSRRRAAPTSSADREDQRRLGRAHRGLRRQGVSSGRGSLRSREGRRGPVGVRTKERQEFRASRTSRTPTPPDTFGKMRRRAGYGRRHPGPDGEAAHEPRRVSRSSSAWKSPGQGARLLEDRDLLRRRL